MIVPSCVTLSIDSSRTFVLPLSKYALDRFSGVETTVLFFEMVIDALNCAQEIEMYALLE